MGEAFGLKDDKGKRLRRKVSSNSTTTPTVNLLRSSTPSETHVILKDNALFLLQLATSSSPEKNQQILERRRRSLMHQPSLSSVSETDKDLSHRKILAPPSKVKFFALTWFLFRNVLFHLLIFLCPFFFRVDIKHQVMFSLGFSFNVFPFSNQDAALKCPTLTAKLTLVMLKWKIHLKYCYSNYRFKDLESDIFPNFPFSKDGYLSRNKRLEFWRVWQAVTPISLYDNTTTCPTFEILSRVGRSYQWNYSSETDQQCRRTRDWRGFSAFAFAF